MTESTPPVAAHPGSSKDLRSPRGWAAGAAAPFLGASGLLIAWQLASFRYTPDQLPGPFQILPAFRDLLTDGTLLRHISISLFRFAAAYGAAVLVGVPFGLWLGWQTLALRALGPVLQLLRPISPIAWFPLAVLWFGIGDAPAIFIIFLAALFPILLSTIGAVREVPGAYLRVAQNFGTPRPMLFLSVVLPASFPLVMNGLRLAVGAAWIHLVAGEMLGAQSGLGFLVVDARNFLRTDLLLSAMVTVGTLGLTIDRCMSLAERRLLRHWGKP